MVRDFALSDKNEEMLIYDEIHDLIHRIRPLEQQDGYDSKRLRGKVQEIKLNSINLNGDGYFI